MYFKKRIKSYFSSLKEALKINRFGYYCPNCAIEWDKSTMFAHILYNAPYHKFQVYINCNECYNTSPAFDTAEKASDNIEDLWIAKENSLFEDDCEWSVRITAKD